MLLSDFWRGEFSLKEHCKGGKNASEPEGNADNLWTDYDYRLIRNFFYLHFRYSSLYLRKTMKMQ